MKSHHLLLLPLIAAVAGFLVTSLFVLSAQDEKERKHRLTGYCENVRLWQLDTTKGVLPVRRAGHPNYKDVSCEHHP